MLGHEIDWFLGLFLISCVSKQCQFACIKPSQVFFLLPNFRYFSSANT